MAVPFDHIDVKNDTALTPYAIGQFQRKAVWDYLSRITAELNGFEILELNVGSGDDALLFGEQDFNIVATDISEVTHKITTQKSSPLAFQGSITSQYLDLDGINETAFHKKFDLVFSNFGGINSMSPEVAGKLFQKMPDILRPGGRFVSLAMSRFCLWESLYFLHKMDFKKIFRRWTKNEVKGYLTNQPCKTWFYSPAQVKAWSKGKFKVNRVMPIGFALPPLSLEGLFTSRKKLLLRLNAIEKKLNDFSLCSSLADNFLIDLQLT
jgi:SAM-dependent methyltransferase